MTQINSKPSPLSSPESLEKTFKDLIQDGLQKEADRLSTLDPVAWIEDKFYIPETKEDPNLRGRIPLIQYQRDCLKEALKIDENGLFAYSTIVWSDIKKSAKSTLGAAIALWLADSRSHAEVYLIANDLKQADSRMAKYARYAINGSPYLNSKFRTRGYSMINKNLSIVEAIPIDPEGEAGANPDAVFYSELWGAMDEAKGRMWTESTLSPTKFGRSFRFVESYAGYIEESEILYDLWELGVKKGELIWPDRKYPVTGGDDGEIVDETVLEVYKNEEARLFCLWNTQPRCPWQSAEYYSQEAAMLHPLEFDRMHRNQWVTNTDTFVPMEWWDACQKTDDEWPTIPANWPMILIADASTRKDTFGVLMVCRHPDRANYPDTTLVQYAENWVPSLGDRGLDYIGTEANPGPEMEMRRLIKEKNMAQLAYDDYQLHDMMNRFRKEGLVWCYRFPQGSGKHSRTISDAALYDRIRDRKVWHRGEPKLREHIQNANAKIDDQERRLRIIKRTEKLKIDLCVCLSMGTYQLFRLNL